MNSGVTAEVNAVRQSFGFWLRQDSDFIRVSGADAAAWLQGQTTNDVEALESGDGQASAVLDRQGRLQAHFTLHRWEDAYWILVDRRQVPRLLEQFESHLFIEDVSIEESGRELEQVVIQGPRALPFLAALIDPAQLPPKPRGCAAVEILGFDVLVFQLSLTGEDGYILVVEAGAGAPLLEGLYDASRDAGGAAIGPRAREVLRVEAGIPLYGVDVNDRCTLPETTLEREAVSYDKGCYIGQEVVSRLRAYGSVKQALVGLVFEETEGRLPEPGEPLHLDGKKIGLMKSVAFSPTLDARIGMAFLDRAHRSPGATLSLCSPESADAFAVKVVALPFHASPGRAERAKALYEEALIRFGKDLRDEDTSAIPLLEEAILLNPAFEDAYEVLGVILQRHNRLDEAIETMRKLVRLNPDCLMAHTNLSVFYVAKGMIEEAEQEKAQAAVLSIQKASNDRRAKALAEAERARLEEEAKERIELFKEVLELDPQDPVATFGLGQAYIQLHRYEDALPHLRKAIQVQKDFSAAHLNLGKCHEFLGRKSEAAAVYREGMEAAGRKGDLMPLREMERRLKAIGAGAVGAAAGSG